jgi:hypothetical protein
MQKVETDILILQETIKSIVVTGAVRTFIGNPTPELQWYDGTKWNTLIEEAPNDGGLYGRKSKGWIALNDDAEPITASNGITKDGNDIKLGGTLDAPTNIDLNDKMLSFSSEFISVLFDSVNGRIMFIVMGENGISDMSVIDIRENIITISTANLTIYNTNIIGRLKLNDESNNILIGDSSGDYLTLNNNGSTNIIIGIDSFQLAENVSNNISIGNLNFKESIDNVVNNIGIGSLVFSKLINGETNIGIGVEVLQYLETGNRNIGIGEFAGMYYDSDSELTLAEKSIFIGSSTKANGDNQTNQIVIGCDATGNGSNTATIGRAEVNTLLDGAIAVLSDLGATIAAVDLNDSLTDHISIVVGGQTGPKGINVKSASMSKIAYDAPVAKVVSVGSTSSAGELGWDTPFTDLTGAGIIVNNVHVVDGERRSYYYEIQLESTMTELQAVQALVDKINADPNRIVNATLTTRATTNYGIKLTAINYKDFNVTTLGELMDTVITVETAHSSGFGTTAQIQEMVDFMAPKTGDRGGQRKYDGYTPLIVANGNYTVYELTYSNNRIDPMQSFNPAMTQRYLIAVPSTLTDIFTALDLLVTGVNA